MTATGHFRVAAVQAAPAYLDRDATLDIVADHVAKAGADGVNLVVFPESFVPGYPDFVWRMPVTEDGDWYERFQDQAVEIDGPHLDKARAAAEAAGVWVALGITERTTSGTLYNSVVYIDNHGKITGLHRKLIPTAAERTVWANGQGPMLTVVDIGGVKVGSLICWENYMPLARAALYAKGIDVLLSPTWDNSDEWVPTLRHIAKEGQVFVVGVTACIRDSDVPADLPRAAEIYDDPDGFLSRGNTTIVAPGGEVLEGPLVAQEGTVTATLDLDRIAAGRRSFDPVGHYARPDVLTLTDSTNGEPR
ncbi:MAG: nitrilase [Candidatus Azotimanducaceae bacterium]|jgi:nitrilase